MKMELTPSGAMSLEGEVDELLAFYRGMEEPKKQEIKQNESFPINTNQDVIEHVEVGDFVWIEEDFWINYTGLALVIEDDTTNVKVRADNGDTVWVDEDEIRYVIKQ